MDVDNDLLYLIASYLSNRSQRVACLGVTSAEVPVTSGVIQGSLLGSLLFTAFIWDLPQCFTHAQCSIYADDTKVFFNVSNLDECDLLQNDINVLYQWCKSWGLDLNLEKCSIISFTKKKIKCIFNTH